MVVVLVVPVAIFCIWLAGFLLANDFSTPLRDARAFQRVLVIFPHADDETVTCGGFLHRLATGGCAVTLVILTKGERGTPDATVNLSLKKIRTQEAQRVARILKISRCIQQDFGDGELHTRKSELRAFVGQLIEQERPDLLVTYDLTGLYGHSDHVACSEVVTDLHTNSFHTIPLWYVTLSRRVLRWTTAPDHITPVSTKAEQRSYPVHRVFIGASVIPKITSWYAYKSQQASLKEGIRRYLPVWFFLSMALFEYFAEAR
ncbi:MAG TPA: PIG-L family deacetylase [Ktedonobacterales bacterium]|nr:PIG-L family deacetylase [Ktedonobacterales bacterium]